MVGDHFRQIVVDEVGADAVVAGKAAGQGADEAAILADILRRDERDRSRAIAPLIAAPDAHELDTTRLDVDAAVAAAIAIVENERSRVR